MKMKYICVIIFISLVVTVSCKKNFSKINTNPTDHTTASDGALFNGVINSLQYGWNEQLYVNNETLYPQTQLAALTQSLWPNSSSIGTTEMWNNYYTTLANIRALQARLVVEDTTLPTVKNIQNMLNIILAYKTFRITDLFGDIPFSQAGYGFQNVNQLQPKFDKQQYIYESLLGKLGWADSTINITATSPAFTAFMNFDNLFQGDLTQWRKLANSLRLRYAMRIADKEPALAAKIIGNIINNNRPVLIGSNQGSTIAEAAAIYPALEGYKDAGKIWSFTTEPNLRMSTTIWNQMTSNDSASGIFDPRVYYFFDTNGNKQWSAYPGNPASNIGPDGGLPYGSQRASKAGYGLKNAGTSICNYSSINYFYISDQNYIPVILMTGAEVNFLEAEAYMRGIGVPQSTSNADNAYLGGILASVTFWNTVMSSTQLLDGTSFSSVITVPANLLTTTPLQNQVDLFNFSTPQQQLQNIYTQCWIELFRQPQEAFSLLRRTNLIPRQGTANQFYRFTIPPGEVSYNTANWSAAYGGNDNTTTKVWWMD